MRNQINFNDIFKSSFWRRCRVFRCWMLLLLLDWRFVSACSYILCTRKLIKESCIQEPSAFH